VSPDNELQSTATYWPFSSMDTIMMSLFNSRERDVEDWEMIFEAASLNYGGFRATRVEENPATGIIQVEWITNPATSESLS
jgi:hypothetical protein